MITKDYILKSVWNYGKFPEFNCRCRKGLAFKLSSKTCFNGPFYWCWVPAFDTWVEIASGCTKVDDTIVLHHNLLSANVIFLEKYVIFHRNAVTVKGYIELLFQLKGEFECIFLVKRNAKSQCPCRWCIDQTLPNKIH